MSYSYAIIPADKTLWSPVVGAKFHFGKFFFKPQIKSSFSNGGPLDGINLYHILHRLLLTKLKKSLFFNQSGWISCKGAGIFHHPEEHLDNLQHKHILKHVMMP
jgi:hypothetical protein